MTNERIRELMVEVMTNTKKGHEEAHKAIKALGYEIKLDNGCRRFVISNPATMRSVAVYYGWRPEFIVKSPKKYISIKSEAVEHFNPKREKPFTTYYLNSKFDIVNFLNTDRKVDNVQPSKYAQARWLIENSNKRVDNALDLIEDEINDYARRVEAHKERMKMLYKNLSSERADAKGFKAQIMAELRK